MFGLFKTKEIDPVRLKENVADKIIDIWSKEYLLPYRKFDSFRSYAEIMKIKDISPDNFSREKLRITTGIATSLLLKANMDDATINEIISLIGKKIGEASRTEIKKITKNLKPEAKEYARLRFSTNARDAGKLVENKFSQQAFGFVPGDDDVDRRYALYKVLSSFEGDAIFQLSSAVRKSRV